MEIRAIYSYKDVSGGTKVIYYISSGFYFLMSCICLYVYFIIVTDITFPSIQYQLLVKIVLYIQPIYGLPVTFVYWYSKKKRKKYIYIHCCELTVPAVTWVLRHKLGYM